jgi:MFS family permease
MLPLFRLLANPGNSLLLIALGSVVGGISGTAGTTAANKFITRYPPPERRATYIALSSTLGSVAGGFGVIVAGIVVQVVQATGLPALEWTFSGFRLTFLASLILRNVAAHVFLPRLQVQRL